MSTYKSDSLHVEPIVTYLMVWFVLMVLLVLTSVAARLNLDSIYPGLNLIVAMVIAVIKALMVVLIFMHVRHSTKLIWAAAGSAFLWLGIFFFYLMSDYMTRGTLPGVDKWTPNLTHTNMIFEHVTPISHPTESEPERDRPSPPEK